MIDTPLARGAHVRGWCPGAWRPMSSGDGLIVRVRPRMARLTREQTIGLCDLAMEYGHGLVDFTNRANLQIRGIDAHDHEAVLERLSGLDLLDPDPETEGKRNILVTPFWADGDLTTRISQALHSALAELPELPAKFGFAIDTGPAPVFSDNSADIRLERDRKGGLVLRADGVMTGRAVSPAQAIPALAELARWFARHSASPHRRMAGLIGDVPLPDEWQGCAPASPAVPPDPGETALGHLLGTPFGQARAADLKMIMDSSEAWAMRVTPWRMFLLESAKSPGPANPFLGSRNDPAMTTDACPGAPFCPQATVETRQTARELARLTGGNLHVSGCAKGCARRTPAAITLVGRDGRYDLVRNGTVWDEPEEQGILPSDLKASL